MNILGIATGDEKSKKGGGREGSDSRQFSANHLLANHAISAVLPVSQLLNEQATSFGQVISNDLSNVVAHH